MPRSTRSGRSTANHQAALQYAQSPIENARRACAKRKVNYNDDSDDSDEYLGRKRLRSGSSQGGSVEDDESPTSSLRSPPAPSTPKLTMAFANLLEVPEGSAAAELFRGLAVEIHQNIIGFFETDRNVARYAAICKETYRAVGDSVWRERCELLFDVVPEDEIIEIKGGDQIVIPWPARAAQLYKIRKVETNRWTTFDSNVCRNLDFETKEIQWTHQFKLLEHLKDLIIESNAKRVTVDGKTMIVGKNFEYIRKLTSTSTNHVALNVLDTLLEEDFTLRTRGENGSSKTKADMLVMVQLCLSPMILGRDSCTSSVYHFDSSQKVVYSNANVPLFKNKYKSQVNINLLINTLNFFKFHLKAGNGEGLMSDAYRRLDEDQLPQMWAGNIPAGTRPLSGNWKGVSIFLDPRELRMLRDKSSDAEIFCDSVEDENQFMDISFFSDESRFASKNWPAAWNTIINSDPYVELDSPLPMQNASQKKKRQPKQAPKPVKRPEIKEFWGTSRGQRTGHMFGRIHSVSNQADFHGWQRVVMVKFFENEGAYDSTQLWIYEGVVLPGGRMILGRWSHPFGNPDIPDDTDSGPFIFWNVDRSTALPPIEPDEAWRFGEQVDDPLFSGLFF